MASEIERVDEIGNRFDAVDRPLVELAMRLSVLNEKFSHPLYSQALKDVSSLPDMMTRYSSLFWDRADILRGGPEAEKAAWFFEKEFARIKNILPPLPWERRR